MKVLVVCKKHLFLKVSESEHDLLFLDEIEGNYVEKEKHDITFSKSMNMSQQFKFENKIFINKGSRKSHARKTEHIIRHAF